MKFYLAARFDRKSELLKLEGILKRQGHRAVVDWMHDDPIHRPYDKTSGLATERAQRDLQGVAGSDVFVLFTEKFGKNKGMYVELGAAIAAYLEKGTPKVYVVGEYVNHGVFFFHPAVNRKSTFQEILDEVKKDN
jgi:hypothetical protein